MNTDLKGPYHFDVFSDPSQAAAEARRALAELHAAAEKHAKTGEPRVLLPSLRLAVKAAEHLLGRGFADNAVADGWGLCADKMGELSRALNRATAVVALLDSGAGPKAVAQWRGDVRIGYRGPVDETDQPFCLYVPDDYTPEKQWPLMVRLHGMWTDIDEAQWTLQTFEWDREFVRYAPRGSFLETYPYGRGNEGYRESGLHDVFDTLALAKELYNVDADRVYLLGSSMGAAGAWRIALTHPGHFAAMALVVGVYDWSLLEGAKPIPTMLIYGGLDSSERVTSPQKTAAKLKEMGWPVEIIGHPESGHRIETTDYQLRYYQFFGKHRRGVEGGDPSHP
jgi:poly(3-hydroxybutyrate) depolymerase